MLLSIMIRKKMADNAERNISIAANSMKRIRRILSGLRKSKENSTNSISNMDLLGPIFKLTFPASTFLSIKDLSTASRISFIAKLGKYQGI